jgi:hypothetical protein
MKFKLDVLVHLYLRENSDEEKKKERKSYLCVVRI